jgi:hypothetical protein
MTTRKAREKIAAIRAQSELGDGRSDGHISYNSFLMNFIADLNDREERAIVSGFKRLRRAANSSVPIRTRNVLMAEGEPTPRAQKILREKSRKAVRERNPIGYDNLQIGPTPRYDDLAHQQNDSRNNIPADSLHRLEQQFSSRSRGGRSDRSHKSQKTSRSSGTPRTARSTKSNGTQQYSSPRWSDLSSLSSGFSSYRSMDSNMTDVSVGDIDALAAQKLRLEQKINTINSRMAMHATKSPKMKHFSKGIDGGERLESSRSNVNSIIGSTGRSKMRGNDVTKNIIHLGETGNPEIVQTSRSETTKLMNTLASRLSLNSPM